MVDFQIPILMYHEISTVEDLVQISKRTKHTYIVTVEQFESQMHWLAEEGFSTVSLYDVVNCIENKNSITLPEKPIIITFDDGFSGNYHYGLPILKKHGFSAVFFITVKQIGMPYMMEWGQLEGLLSEGMYIQSHSMTHPLLGQLNRDGVAFELKESKRILQDKLETSVDFLSLPDGSYNKYYKDIAIDAGYRGGCTSKTGIVNPSCDPYFLNRIIVDSKYSINEFKYIAEARTEFIKKIIFKRLYKIMILKIVGEKLYNQLYRFVNKFHWLNKLLLLQKLKINSLK